MDVDTVLGALSVANIARVVVAILAVIGGCTWLLQALLPYLRSMLPQREPEKLSDDEVARLELERRRQVLELQERQRKASAARVQKEKERMARAKEEQKERERKKTETYGRRGHFAREEKGSKKKKRANASVESVKESEGDEEQREVDCDEDEMHVSDVEDTKKASKKSLRSAVKERKDRIPSEPPVPSTEEEQKSVTKIVVRLVVGKPITRRFLIDTTLATVKDWVEVEDPSLIGKEFVFRTTYPHRVHDDLSLTIEEAGLQGTLLLVSMDE